MSQRKNLIMVDSIRRSTLLLALPERFGPLLGFRENSRESRQRPKQREERAVLGDEPIRVEALIDRTIENVERAFETPRSFVRGRPRSGSLVISGGSTLSATSRPSFVSSRGTPHPSRRRRSPR